MCESLSVAGIAVLFALAILVVVGIVLFIRRKQNVFVIVSVFACVIAISLVSTGVLNDKAHLEVHETSEGWYVNDDLAGTSVPYSDVVQVDGIDLSNLADNYNSDPAVLSSNEDFLSYADSQKWKDYSDPSVPEEMLASLGEDYFDEYDLVIAPFWTKTGAQTGSLLGIAVKDNETNVYIQLSHLDPRYSYTADIGGGVFYLQVKKGSCPSKVNIVLQED